MAVTASDVVNEACQDAMVLGPGEVLAGDVAANVLSRLNRILDNWNADQKFAYAERSDTFTITPGLNPHTLGPTGTFNYAVRPVTIDSAAVVDTSVSPNIQIPIKLRDWQWYARLASPDTTATYEVSAYYQPDWPNGSLFLWPVPTTAYGINLYSKTVLSQLTLTSTFSLPPGYRDAITLTLAENISMLFEQQPNPLLVQKAAEARRRAFGNNMPALHIATRDSGMPDGANLPSFNWQTGLFR